MSRNTDHYDDRNDSALSLGLDQGASTRTVASRRGLVASPSWSLYNLRQDSLTESVYEPSASSIFGNNHLPAMRALPQGSDLATSPNPPYSAPSVTSQEPFASSLSCRQCSIQFTGTYRAGNLARHVRQKHSDSRSRAYLCRAVGCFRAFRRSDARLKHERKTHLELGLALAHDRATVHLKAHSADIGQDELCPLAAESVDKASPLRLSSLSNEHGAAAEVDTPEHPMIENVSLLPAAAWETFFKLHAKLDDIAYSQHCDKLFARWAVVAEALRVQNEKLYVPFARVLSDLNHVIEAIDCHVPKDNQDDQNAAEHTEHTHQPRFHQGPSNSIHNPGGQPGSRPGPSSKQRQRRHGSGEGQGKASRSPIIAVKQHNANKKQLRKIDCPFYKRWLFYFRDRFPPPCNGCSERYMSQIRNHVKRAHIAQNGCTLAFYHHCVRCKENFVDAQSWTDHASHDSCAHVGESRGDPVIPWAKLYLKLHPGMTEIPTPYTDEHEWLSPAVLTLCLQQASRSFLGRQTQRTTVTAPLWREPSLSYDQSTYNAFLDVMLQEAGGGDTYTNTDPNVVFQALNPADDRVAYIDQLNYARNQYLGLLFHAPRHLSAQELRDVTSVLGQVASAAHTYHAAFTTPAALSVNTHASTDEMDHVFSDLALSPQTDRTTAPDINALDSSGRNDYQGSPLEAINAQETLPLTQDLAFFDLGSDIGGADVHGSLEFRDGC